MGKRDWEATSGCEERGRAGGRVRRPSLVALGSSALDAACPVWDTWGLVAGSGLGAWDAPWSGPATFFQRSAFSGQWSDDRRTRYRPGCCGVDRRGGCARSLVGHWPRLGLALSVTRCREGRRDAPDLAVAGPRRRPGRGATKPRSDERRSPLRARPLWQVAHFTPGTLAPRAKDGEKWPGAKLDFARNAGFFDDRRAKRLSVDHRRDRRGGCARSLVGDCPGLEVAGRVDRPGEGATVLGRRAPRPPGQGPRPRSPRRRAG